MRRAALLALAVLALLLPALTHHEALGANTIAVPDIGGYVGVSPSLALDAAGNPVVSSYGSSTGQASADSLRILHCGHPSCRSGNSLVSVDSVLDSGAQGDFGSSLALDGTGNPVVSYYGGADGDLKILHCNDPNCAGADESIVPVDVTGNVGQSSSLALDVSGNPVVSYYDATNGDLKVLHCNDAGCTGGDESIATPDSGDRAGFFGTSLALDSLGNPVISYMVDANPSPSTFDGDLRVLHCGDADCMSGNTIATADSTGSVGFSSSLTLDSSGLPAIAYLDDTNGDLKLLRCGDAMCSAGNAISAPATGGNVGEQPSLALDVAGLPVIAYGRGGSGPPLMQVLRCSDGPCTSGSVATPDSVYQAGFGQSLALDAAGYPVVAYNASGSSSEVHLRVLHCADDTCGNNTTIVPSGNPPYPASGAELAMALDSVNNPVFASRYPFNTTINITHCVDRLCIHEPDPGSLPLTSIQTSYLSMVLDSSDNPVVAYYDAATADLKIVHCGNTSCSSGNTVTTPDSTGSVGTWISLALDGAGNPVVSYRDATTQRLKVLHCGDPACTSGNSIATPDPSGNNGEHTALDLDAAGNPVVAYRESISADLRVLHCGNPNCTAGNVIATAVSTGNAGQYVSMELDGAGNPAMSYWDGTLNKLYVLHCGDPECTSGNSLNSLDGASQLGARTSLEIDAGGNPVIAYSDQLNDRLKVAHCIDPSCSGAPAIFAQPSNSTGDSVPLLLDSLGNPVAAYGDYDNDYRLTLLRCIDPDCLAGDFDGDGCPNEEEQQTAPGTELSGGRRDSKDPNDYFNPSGDGLNRVDDILLVVQAYFDDDDDGNPGLPPYEPGYDPGMDRTYVGPLAWNLGPPNGLQRVDDILNSVKQYFHDCS